MQPDMSCRIARKWITRFWLVIPGLISASMNSEEQAIPPGKEGKVYAKVTPGARAPGCYILFTTIFAMVEVTCYTWFSVTAAKMTLQIRK